MVSAGEHGILERMNTTVGPDVNFLNVEYFFRIIYNLLHGAPDFTMLQGSLLPFLMHVWILVGVISFGISAVCIYVLLQSTARLNEVYARAHQDFATIDITHATEEAEHHRWTHVKTLIESAQESDWRQAILEADIMLEDMLIAKNFPGDSVGDKLKLVDRAHFETLDEAWTAHRVRNDIAHRGSTIALSNQLAYRTISHYENVFREFHFI